jgi:hypothetical protein
MHHQIQLRRDRIDEKGTIMIRARKSFVVSLGLSLVLCAMEEASATPAYEYAPYIDDASQMKITDFGPHVLDMLGVCAGEEVHFNIAAEDNKDKKIKKRADGTIIGNRENPLDWEDVVPGEKTFQIQFFVTGGAFFESSSGVPLTFREFVGLRNAPQANNLKMNVKDDWDGGFINVSGYVNDNAPPLTHPDSGYRNDPTVSKSWSFAPRIGNAPTSIELVGAQFGNWYPANPPAPFSYRLKPLDENYANQTVTEFFSDSGTDIAVPGDLSESWLNAMDVSVAIFDENGMAIGTDTSAREAESQRRRALTTPEELMAYIGGVPDNEGTFIPDGDGVIDDSQGGKPATHMFTDAAMRRGIKTWFILTFKSCGQEIGKVKVTRRTKRQTMPGEEYGGAVVDVTEVMVELA